MGYHFIIEHVFALFFAILLFKTIHLNAIKIIFELKNYNLVDTNERINSHLRETTEQFAFIDSYLSRHKKTSVKLNPKGK